MKLVNMILNFVISMLQQDRLAELRIYTPILQNLIVTLPSYAVDDAVAAVIGTASEKAEEQKEEVEAW